MSTETISNFDYAHGLTADIEAGINDMQEDTGNQYAIDGGGVAYTKTYYGITLGAWATANNIEIPKTQEGFDQVNSQFQAEFEGDEVESRNKVTSYFKTLYWDKHKLDEISDKRVAASIYDALVNQNFSFGDIGKGNESMLSALNNAGYEIEDFKSLDDAIFHVNKAIEQEGGDKVLNSYGKRREQSYITSSQKGDNSKFSRGWMNRLNNYYTPEFQLDTNLLKVNEPLTVDSVNNARPKPPEVIEDESIEGISSDEPTMEEQAAEIERRTVSEEQVEGNVITDVKPSDDVKETEQQEVDMFTPQQPQPEVQDRTELIINQGSTPVVKENVELTEDDLENIIAEDEELEKPSVQKKLVDDVNKGINQILSPKVEEEDIIKEEQVVEEESQLGPTQKSLDKKEALDKFEKEQAFDASKIYLDSKKYIEQFDDKPDLYRDEKEYKERKLQYEKLIKRTDQILDSSGEDYGDSKEDLRVSLLSVMTEEDYIALETGKKFEDDFRFRILLRAKEHLLDTKGKDLLLESSLIEAADDKMADDKVNIENEIAEFDAGQKDLVDRWQKIRQTGYYVGYEGKQIWQPDFKNKEEQEAYNQWVLDGQGIEEERLRLNQTLKDYKDKNDLLNDRKSKYKENVSTLFADLNYNEAEKAFNPTHGVIYKYAEDGTLMVSTKASEGPRNLIIKLAGEREGLVDVYDGTIGLLLDKFLEPTAQFAVDIVSLPLQAIVAGGSYLASYLGAEYTDVVTGRTITPADFLTTYADSYTKKKIIPFASRFADEDALEFEGFFKSKNANEINVPRYLTNVIPYTLSLIVGTGKFVKARDIAIKAKELKGFSKKQLKHWNRGGNFKKGSALFGIYDTGSKIQFNRRFFDSLNKRFRFTERAAINLKQIDLTYRMLYLENVAYMKNEGLTSEEAMAAAHWMSFATGLSQAIMPDYYYIAGKSGQGITKEFVNSIKKIRSTEKIGKLAKKQAFGDAGKTFLSNIMKEITEEELDILLNDVIKSAYITSYHPEVLKASTQSELLLGTLFLSGALGGYQAKQNYKSSYESVYGAAYLGAYDTAKEISDEMKAFENKLAILNNKKRKSGKDKQEISILQKSIEGHQKALNLQLELLDVVRVAPDKVTFKTLDLLRQKQKLVKEKNNILKTKDKVASKSQIDEINEKIASVDAQIENDDYTKQREELFEELRARGEITARAEGFEYHETRTKEEHEKFRVIENARRLAQNKKLAKEIKEIKSDKKNYDKNGDLNDDAKQKVDKLRSQIVATIPDFDSSLRKGAGFIVYDDVTKKHTVIVNPEIALESGNFAVVQHEVLHGMLRETMIKDPELMVRLSYLLREELSKNPGLNRYVINKFGSYSGGNLTTKNADELLTIMSEALLQNRIKLSKNFLSKFVDMVRRVARKFGINFKIKDIQDLQNFIEDYAKEAKRGRFSKGLRKIKEEGLQSIMAKKNKFKLTAEQRKTIEDEQQIGQVIETIEGDEGLSRSVYNNDKLVEDLELSANTKKIVERNAEIRKKILEQGIVENGKVVASPELQNELVENNLALAMKLADFAAKNPNIMGLEAGKRVTREQFLSGYYEQLSNLARTYDARVNEFGQYLNGILPLRYGQILKAETVGQVEGTVSIDTREARELADTDEGMDARYNDSETIRPDINVSNRLGGSELQDRIQEHFDKGVKMILDGPMDNQTREQWLQELTDLGFADLDGTLPDISDLDFAQMQPYAFQIIADYYGVDRDKLDWRLNKKNKDAGLIPKGKKASFMANLRIDSKKGTNELQTIQRRVRGNPEIHIAAGLPRAFVGTKEKPIKSNKVRPLLLKNFYNRGKKVNNVNLFFRFPVVDVNDFLEKIGIVEGVADRSDRNTSAFANAIVFEIARKVSAQGMKQSLARFGSLNDKTAVGLDDGINAFSESKVFKDMMAKDQSAAEYTLTMIEKLKPQILGLIIDFPASVEDNVKLLRRELNLLFKQNFDSNIVKPAIQQALIRNLTAKTGIITKYGFMINNYATDRGFLPDLAQFTKEELHSYNETSEVFELLGLYGEGVGSLIRSEAFTPYHVTRGRINVVRIVKDIKSRAEAGTLVPGGNAEENKARAMLYIQMLRKHHSKSSRIASKNMKGNGRIRPTVDNSNPRGFRASIFENASDFDKLISSVDDGYFELNLSPSKIKEKYNIKLVDDLSSNIIKNYISGDWDAVTSDLNEQADAARELTKYLFIFNWKKYGSKNNKNDQMMFAQFLFNLGVSMESPSRKSAKIFSIATNVVDNNNNLLVPTNQTTYEHQKPHHHVITKITSILQNEPEAKWNSLIDKVFNDYVVSIIRATKDETDFDDLLQRSGLKSKMQRDYDEDADINNRETILKTSIGRSFNDITAFDSAVSPIKVINKDFALNGEIIGEEFVSNGQRKVKQSLSYNEAAKMARSMKFNDNLRGISILDFDDTLATTNSRVRYTSPDGRKGFLNAEEYARDYVSLLNQGYKFDFSEFNEVVDGKVGPLFDKAVKLANKYGTEDMYVLTARPPEAQRAIYDFLKSVGLNIPYDNITGLANSTAEAKALWIVKKVEEGYNDIYFADDALQNVTEVANVLDQLDVKSKVQQAKISRSEKFSDRFNEILEEREGVGAEKRFSEIKGRRRGKDKGKFRFFIPPSAEDFLGLIYNFLPKGAKGDAALKFFQDTLLRPYANAIAKINNARQLMMNEYGELLKKTAGMRKRLREKVIDGDFTIEDAVRVYLWSKAGFEIPGLSETDRLALVNIVEKDEQLLAFALSVSKISREKAGYLEPNKEWELEGIKFDLFQKSSRVKRAEFLQDFKNNREIIFGKFNGRKLVGANMNKIEAIYGKGVRNALDDIIWRMENGTNRAFGDNKLVNDFMNWLNGSVAATMFVNMRSALLQQLSFVNFINWEDNNIFAASKAFANQEQFWTDFSFLFNSNFLKQRRSGLRSDLNASELITHLSKSRNKTKAALQWLLQKGFLPTQIADSFAIAIGGASFYRNRVNKYVKEGMSKEDAQKKAFTDFQEIAERTQQSARADMISQEQASVLGRLILAFQNTPMQYARLTKRALQDLVNGRGSMKANISRIIYYGMVQNLIFYTLQTAMFAMMFEDDDEEEYINKKGERILNGMSDSFLRGMGVGGAVVSTLKNMLLRAMKESAKPGGRADYAYVLLEMANLAPPVGIKLRKVYSATQSYKFNRDEIEEMGYVDIDNPTYEIATSTLEGIFNVPVNRAYNKIRNIRASLDSDNAVWQRIALALGWNTWDLGIDTRKKKDEFDKIGFDFDDFDFDDDDFDFDDFDFD